MFGVEVLLLKDFVIIFGLSIVVLLLFHRLKIPSIVGFLLTGMLAGPYGFGLIEESSQVQQLAEIGIIVLLFTVGIDFSLKRVWKHKRLFLIGGGLQVLLTALSGILIGFSLGRPTGESIFLGFLLALSSTAIVARLLQERVETNTPHGQFILAVLIFQDIAVVPMLLITPILAGEEFQLSLASLWVVLKGFLILGSALVAAELVVPRLLHLVARTRNRELFLLSVLTIGFSVAWLTSSIGLSLALGAFLAGLIISESEYGHQAIGNILPVQDIFTSFFFVSIGMSLDTSLLYYEPHMILILSFGVFLLKSFIAGNLALFLKLPLRSAVLCSIALFQVGEFSFLLMMKAAYYGIGTPYLNQLFLAVAIITMGATPILFKLTDFVTVLLLKLPLPRHLKEGMSQEAIQPKEDHVVIVGFGFSGKELAGACEESKIPFVVIDLDPDSVRLEKQRGTPIFFGDATHDYVLRHAGILQASILVVVVNDPHAAQRIVARARSLNLNLSIIVRTQYMETMKEMYAKGADLVIPDEFGSTIELFSHVLLKYEVPQSQIEKRVVALRKQGYDLLRHRYINTTLFKEES